MYLILGLIIIGILLILCNINKVENFDIKGEISNIVYNNVIPSEYKSYLLKVLIFIFNFISDKTDGYFKYIPYEIIEIISKDNIINILFFANSPNGFNSLVFKAQFKLINKKLELLNIQVRDIKNSLEKNKKTNNIYGIDTFKIIYPNQNIGLIDLDNVTGILNKDITQYAKINYKINPIINPDLLRVNILPITSITDFFPKYPFWNDDSLHNTNLMLKNRYLKLGNYYTPGMFKIHTDQKSMFSKFYDIPSFPFSNTGSCSKQS
jgi:hypothetical protein